MPDPGDVQIIRATAPWELAAVFYVRVSVGLSLGVGPDKEIDEKPDEPVHHLVILDGREPVAAGRWRDWEGKAKLERIGVVPQRRGQGWGRRIIEALEVEALAAGKTATLLTARIEVEKFYQNLGYQSGEDVQGPTHFPLRWYHKALSSKPKRN
jgi:GNAT superfamily N-acetyltransferase